MALAVIGQGDQTATIGTEHSLVTDTTGKTYVFVVDTGNMANDDVLELRIKTTVRSGGTKRVAYYALYQHAQASPQKYSVPVPANIEFEATLKQTAGTGRIYPWSVLSLD